MNNEILDNKQHHTNNNFNNTDIVINHDRTIGSGFGSLEKTANFHSVLERHNECMGSYVEEDLECVNNIKIYRYKFSDEFVEELYKFSKIHQYDDRDDFKEAWATWMKEQNELILRKLNIL
jgi:hypothetical protein